MRTARPLPGAPATIPLAAALALALLAPLGARMLAGPDEPWPLVAPAPAVELRPERLTELEGLGCGECHADVVEQWAGTAHAIAWRDEVYQAALAERSNPGLCTSCHIPAPFVIAGEPTRPKAREEALHLGIDCAACHLAEDGAWLGPHGAATDAHATRKSALFTPPGSNELCARCHSSNIGPVIGIAKDFEEAKLAERGLSCVGCHTALLPRESEDDPLVRSHALQTPRDPTFLRRAFALRLEGDGDATRVVVSNRAGHRVPGLIGREIRFTVQALDEAGEVIASAERTLDARAHLPVGGEVELALARRGARVRIVGDHTDPRRPDRPVRFLDEELE